ncbi:molybdopterin-dependent oxidoreductase [Eubacteriaceae bacterium ES3]|nr:molybdopterin-dependent oxidoreductase [Eubacteriaceae bacterium ES3]
MESYILTINGKKHQILAKPNWTLMYVIREVVGLTGTKCGCSTGDCGACTVILDGEAVRSCTTLVKNVKDKTVETIEGLSKGTDLHPIQKAFIDNGAIQCGFCTPGIIMVIKAFLDRNPDPTEDEIRQAINGNLCRCTGYAKVVKAIQQAARVMRHEDQVMEAAVTAASTKGTIGRGVAVIDADLKATGSLKYTGDIVLPGMLHAKVLFSPHPHAKIISIDTSKAEALEGVEAVVCYKDSPDVRFNSNAEDKDASPSELVFDQIVRYVGDKVAAVAATSIEIAEAAVKLIDVEYEMLPYYLDPKEAMKEDAYQIHDFGNCLDPAVIETGDVDGQMAKASHVFEDTYSLQPIHHSAMEPHVSIAQYDISGKLTVYTPTQDVFGQRSNLSRIFGMSMNKIRVIRPAIGGGFGGKVDLVTEPVAALLSMKAMKPVKLVYTRREDIASSRIRHAMDVKVKTGVDEEGRIIAQDIQAVVNAGAHTSCSTSVAWAMSGKFLKVHKNKNIRINAQPVYTNTPVAAAMRGFGSPQGFFAQQRQLNRIAHELNKDITDLQLLNLVDPWDLESDGVMNVGNARAKDCVIKGKEDFSWADEMATMAASKQENGRYRIGVGMALGAHGNGLFNVMADTTGIMIKLNEDGSATFFTGVSDMGNGSSTLQAMAISEVLGITMDRIACHEADTETTLFDVGAYASRGTYISAQAARVTAVKVRETLEKYAAEYLDIPVKDVDFINNEAVSVRDFKTKASIGDLVIHAHEKHGKDICESDTFSAEANAVSYGAHFVKVQIDTQTGAIKVLKYVAIHDVGKPLNPLGLEGQVEGGIQMGMGQALSEGIIYDNQGKVTNRNFKNYTIPRAMDMPHIKAGFINSNEASGPFGGKSIGECAVVPSLSAIVNAVANGMEKEYNDLPVTADAVLASLNKNDQK